MPRGDRTGPNGAGPRTGRGLGDCPNAGGQSRRSGLGRGTGAGRSGRGRGRK